MPTKQQQALAHLRRDFRLRGWNPFKFQVQAWQAYLEGQNGIVHSPTGTGKTMAVFLGPVAQYLIENPEEFRRLKQRQSQRMAGQEDVEPQPSTAGNVISPIRGSNGPDDSPTAASIRRLNRQRRTRRKLPALNPNSSVRILWVTPLRALATDTAVNLTDILTHVGLDWKVEKRTGDSEPALKARQRKKLPEVLVTTPESLTLMLTWPETASRFEQLQLVVVDEWHALMGTKRGVQTELALARIQHWQPNAQRWGLSATIGNLEEALDYLCPTSSTQTEATGDRKQNNARPRVLISSDINKRVEIRSLIPNQMERFPWAGHLGIRLAPEVAEKVMSSRSCLVFTNTRSQTEFWYQALLKAQPELAGQLAVHHGSLDQQVRFWVEDALREGRLKCVVCTASLDLGVDFTIVDHIVQVGSPKGNARLLQRAGRSGHQPGETSQVTFVPTNAMELIELAAIRESLAMNEIEAIEPLTKPLDVLAQHLVSIAIGGGFVESELRQEVVGTQSYRDLSDLEWRWTMDFVTRGGESLKAYPDFHRIVNENGRWVVRDKKIERLHRLSIGTIVSDAAVKVKYLKGASLGTVEESFIGRLKPGDKFSLGGKQLELVKVHDNAAWVKRATGKTTSIPRWMGGRMPLSSELSHALRRTLQAFGESQQPGPELKAVAPLLEIQQAWSAVPTSDQLLLERFQNRDGHHLFLYPFDGRQVHEGLAALLAWRWSRQQPISFSMAMNDYGLVLVSSKEVPLDDGWVDQLLRDDTLADDILESLNGSEMCRRQFREIARVAGLVLDGYPGQRKSARQIQASSNLFFDVFQEYDLENLLLRQAQREVLERQLEKSRLVRVLRRLRSSEIVLRHLKKPTPFSFPLLVDRLRDRLSSEKLSDRIRSMQEKLEREADRFTTARN